MEEYKELYKRAFKRLLQMHFEAGVGHLGGNLSCLDILLVLHHYVMGDHDKFVLSKGHAAGAYYVTQWTKGLLNDEDLKTFHGEWTLLAGHLPGTGSLGHGLSMAAGMALAKKLKGERGLVYCVTSDGEWDEGQMWEAVRFARKNQLNNLQIIIDGNGFKGFDEISDEDKENYHTALHQFGYFEYFFQEEMKEFIEALLEWKSWVVPKPLIIHFESTKGRGIATEGKLESHYLPITEEQYREALRRIDDENQKAPIN